MRKLVLASAALILLSTSASHAASADPANKSYVVFFEKDQTTLTPEGRQIVKLAAERARRSRSNMVTVAAPQVPVVAGYNPALASPRIATVQQALIANGVSRGKLARAPVSDKAKVGEVGAARVEIHVLNTSSEQST